MVKLSNEIHYSAHKYLISENFTDTVKCLHLSSYLKHTWWPGCMQIGPQQCFIVTKLSGCLAKWSRMG